MNIYYGLGNTAAVIRIFEQCKQQLAKEYGLEPSENTVRCFESLVRSKY
jgi:DNA-binding SARP family transcriptional activator